MRLKKVIGVLVVMALVTTALVGLGSKKSIEINRVPYKVEDDIRYTTFIVEEPIIEKDVIYDKKKELALDVYMPEKVEDIVQKRSAILLMHGGGFTKGDKATDELTKSFAIDLSRMGYVVFNANYTLSSKGNLSAIKKACSDIEEAFIWIQNNSESYGVDVHHIAVGGYSAGAVIANHLVYSNKYKIDSNDVLGVLDIAGGRLGFGGPIKGNPPCLILHGKDDTTVKFSDSEAFVSRLEKAGVEAWLYAMEDITHTLISRFDEMRNQASAFLYKQLTGEEKAINLLSDTNPEYRKAEERKKNGIVYEAKQVTLKLDGTLDEWVGLKKIDLKELKDAGETMPDGFEGYAYVGWNEKEPGKLYVAASITDSEVSVNKAQDTKWYNDDCLEIAMDLSDKGITEQIMKWVISADCSKLSVLATESNTKVAYKKEGNTTNYEICIDINDVGAQVRNNKASYEINSQTVMGFSIAYNNSKNGERIAQIGWTKGASSERKLMGNLKFR